MIVNWAYHSAITAMYIYTNNLVVTNESISSSLNNTYSVFNVLYFTQVWTDI